jgi:trk system potassium uptake protein TrkH
MKHLHKLNALQILALGFMAIILIGTILLMLPIANRQGGWLPFIDALFTAASATCVTGLVVYDTFLQFSLFGQIVILLLIQIGGLGFMTVAVMFAMVLHKRIGLKERATLMEAINTMQIGGVVRLSRRILIGTALIELTGAILLSFVFVPDFGFWQGAWFSIFHSVSAFCNSGFDLMGIISPYASLMPYVSNVLVNVVMMVLIIIGGLGFVVWDDLMDHKFHFKKYRLHTKIVLFATTALIALSAVLFLIFERNSSLLGMTAGEKILTSLFGVVTPRTAGFNTVPVTSMSEAGSALTMILMLIGAAPGSTGGGIKITTLVVLLIATNSYVRGKEDVNLFGRRLDNELIRKAYNSTMFYMLLAIVGCFIILGIQSFSFLDVMYETISAIGTVGLSRGITAGLFPISKMVLILLMYLGRVGSMSVAMAFVERKHVTGLKNPVEKIIIG